MFFRKPDQAAGDSAVPSPPADAKPAVASTHAPAQAAAVAHPAAASHGDDAKKAAELSPDEAKRRALMAKQMAASLGELVMLLMRSPTERHHTLGDIEWLIAPAIIHGQFAIAEAQSKDTGVVTPVGAVLWAFVSPDVDARLSDVSNPMRLKPNEWRSGNIPWIAFIIGDNRVLGGLLEQLYKNIFTAQRPKMRVRGADGKFAVGQLEIKEREKSN